MKYIIQTFFRWTAYETFLSIHQFLVISIAIGTVGHLSKIPGVNIIPIYIYTCVFTLINLYYLICFMYRNFRLGHPWPFARIYKFDTAIQIDITIPMLSVIKPGQYVTLWLPRVEFWSSHPFMVAGSEVNKQRQLTRLSLLVKPENGFTLKLWEKLNFIENIYHDKGIDDKKAAIEHSICFAGPFSGTAHLHNIDRVIMLATGFGIVSMLSYVEDFIRQYKSYKLKRICLVWIMENSGM